MRRSYCAVKGEGSKGRGKEEGCNRRRKNDRREK